MQTLGQILVSMIPKPGPAESHFAATTPATRWIPADKLSSCLVVPRRDRPELLDFREQVLHRVPPAIHVPVMFPWLRPVPPRRGHRPGTPSLQLPDQPVGVERPVADEGPERKIIEKGGHSCEVAPR